MGTAETAETEVPHLWNWQERIQNWLDSAEFSMFGLQMTIVCGFRADYFPHYPVFTPLREAKWY